MSPVPPMISVFMIDVPSRVDPIAIGTPRSHRHEFYVISPNRCATDKDHAVYLEALQELPVRVSGALGALHGFGRIRQNFEGCSYEHGITTNRTTIYSRTGARDRSSRSRTDGP